MQPLTHPELLPAYFHPISSEILLYILRLHLTSSPHVPLFLEPPSRATNYHKVIMSASESEHSSAYFESSIGPLIVSTVGCQWSQFYYRGTDLTSNQLLGPEDDDFQRTKPLMWNKIRVFMFHLMHIINGLTQRQIAHDQAAMFFCYGITMPDLPLPNGSPDPTILEG